MKKRTKDNDDAYMLSKREYFAAIALGAIISKRPFEVPKSEDEAIATAEMIANGAIAYADAIISVLNDE